MPARRLVVSGTPYLLDVRPDRLDLRDRMYQPPTLALPPQYPADADIQRYLAGYLAQDLVLDQGEEGACTGFGLAAVINYLLWVRAMNAQSTSGFQSVSPYMLYDLARFYDEWPGQDYEGSSCRGAMKGWHKHGACERTLWKESIYPVPARPRKKKTPPNATQVYRPDAQWPLDASARPLGVYYRIDRRSVTDLQTAIRDVGAVYVSASVHAGWTLKPKKDTGILEHAAIPRIPYAPKTPVSGGHAFALVGYNEDGFVVQNSWGTDWGLCGFAVMRYADWVENGVDAWVCTLGVPQRPLDHGASSTQPSSTRRAVGHSVLMGDSQLRVAPRNPAAAPWTTEQAYLHSVVTGNDGVVDTARPDCADAAAHVDEVAVQRVLSWAAAHPGQVPRVVVYAHGGLNSEAEAIERARVLGPYFLGNGIYPIFTVWKTGIWETIGQELEDRLVPEEARLATGVLAEARDRLIEALAHGPLRWMWRQMKENAQRATEPGRGSSLLAAALGRLRGFLPNAEVHVVGHSAGSFVAGHLLAQGLSPSSLTLYAPACPLAFALSHVVPHAPAGKTWLHLLSDKVERDDCVGSQLVYGKSLLYLVARGFEEVRKTPLAGLQRCADVKATQPDDDLWTPDTFALVQQWRAWVQGLTPQADGKPACEIIESIQVDKDGKKRAATHGGFDNDVITVARTINRMLGQKPAAKLPVPVEDLDY